MEWMINSILLLIACITFYFLLRNEIKKKDKYATLEQVNAIEEEIERLEKNKKKYFLEHCEKCKEEWKVYDKQVTDNIKDIQNRLDKGDKLLTSLGVIQVAMCKHINMPQEDIEMFKDAIFNGRDIR